MTSPAVSAAPTRAVALMPPLRVRLLCMLTGGHQWAKLEGWGYIVRDCSRCGHPGNGHKYHD